MPSPITLIKNGLRRSPLRKAVMTCRHVGLSGSDVFLASYPRSGNTWLKSLLTSCIFGKAMQNFSDTVDPVIPIVGYHRGVKPLLRDAGRIIKTHESFRPQYQRSIWVVRDPRDVVLSEYKLQLRSGIFSGKFEDYLSRFTTTERNGPPDWQTHTKSWLQGPTNNSAVLKIRFEDMRKDTGKELGRALSFLGLDSGPEVIEAALQQNSLTSMADRHAAYDKTLGKAVKTNLPAVNQGLSGGWRTALQPQQIASIEESFGRTMEELGYQRSSS